MEEAVLLAEPNGHAEQIRKMFLSENEAHWPVRENAPFAQEDHALAPQDRDGRSFAGEWIALPGNGLDQRGLAASVGPKNTKVFAGPDLQCDVVEGGPLLPRAAQDGHVFQGEEWKRRGGHF